MKTGIFEKHVECLICGYEGRNLTNHLRHKHKITARDYKERFELNYSQPLECKETTEKRRIAVEMNQHVIENLVVGGKTTRYTKGVKGNKRLNEQRLEKVREAQKKSLSNRREKSPKFN